MTSEDHTTTSIRMTFLFTSNCSTNAFYNLLIGYGKLREGRKGCYSINIKKVYTYIVIDTIMKSTYSILYRFQQRPIDRQICSKGKDVCNVYDDACDAYHDVDRWNLKCHNKFLDLKLRRLHECEYILIYVVDK